MIFNMGIVYSVIASRFKTISDVIKIKIKKKNSRSIKSVKTNAKHINNTKVVKIQRVLMETYQMLNVLNE